MKGFIIGGAIGGVSGIVIGLLVGLLAGQVISFAQTGGVQVPFELKHITIADSMNVVVSGHQCKMAHLYTTIAQFHPTSMYDMREIAPFASEADKQYTTSFWVFTLDNNPKLAMKIIGASSKDTYIIEFGSITFADVAIRSDKLGFTHTLTQTNSYTIASTSGTAIS